MKKIVKGLVVLALIAMLCFAPSVNNAGPGPDDRPIGYSIGIGKLEK